jgi:hypothetical protein
MGGRRRLGDPGGWRRRSDDLVDHVESTTGVASTFAATSRVLGRGDAGKLPLSPFRLLLIASLRSCSITGASTTSATALRIAVTPCRGLIR